MITRLQWSIAGAVAAIFAIGYVVNLKLEIRALKAEVAAAEARHELIGRQCEYATDEWRQITDRIRTELDQCQQNWQRAEMEGIEAVTRAEQAREQAQARAKEWRDRYLSRPQGCKSALAALDTQCSALSDY